MTKWIKDSIFYEIYPTSFKDSNGDGIGDLNGITSKLDYVNDLGFNAIWINPFYKSPFKDGGYDVSDFFSIDSKFGTLNDFQNLLNKAHSLGMHVIIDLVPGHASEENPIFLESANGIRNENYDLFIWNSCVWDLEQPYRLIAGRHDRNGCYLVNFFSTQPAFNFGFNNITHPNWQMSYKDQRTKKAREYIKSIIRYWLKIGVDGFRVDMADSLVKNDDDKTATMEIWKEIHEEIFVNEYPNAVLVSEWSHPDRALACGFDVDFVLEHSDNFYHYLVRSNENNEGTCVLKKGDQSFFKKDLLERITSSFKYNGHLGIISGNHDTCRISTFLNDDQLKLFYILQFTLPGIPFVYYGDEIGMKHRDIPSKDGGYQRTGDRTPMQWDNTKNRGFSSTDGELYLPLIDEICNVEDCLKDKKSITNFIKNLIKIRKSNHEFVSKDFAMKNVEGIIEYSRKNIKIVINLSNKDYQLTNVNEILLKTSDDCFENNLLKDNSAIIYK